MSIQIEGLNIQKSILFLLNEKYSSEFIKGERYEEHPSGVNFYEWLFQNSLISAEEMKRINNEIEEEERAENDYDKSYHPMMDEAPTAYD